MQTHPCHREQLAAGDFAVVEICDCGSLHLTIGAVTLRLSPSCLPELASVVGDARRELALHELIARRRATACAEAS
jgi:hypothetical protein